jgi:hypothetical protein
LSLDAVVTRSRRAGLWGLGVLLAILTCWAYAPMLENGFVWDDAANLVSSRPRWAEGAEGLGWSFTRPFAGHYQPLTWISYRLDLLVSGATPKGVHATNLLLHGLATALVGRLAWVIAGLVRRHRERTTPLEGFRPASALLCAALFALHPIHVETVAWATERRDLLSTVLVLSAVLLHLRTPAGSLELSPVRHAVAGFHALAALARAQVSLPFVLLAIDLWPLNRTGTLAFDRRSFLRLVSEKRVSFGVSALSSALALWAQSTTGALTLASEHGVLARVVQTGYNLAFYPLALLYQPFRLPLYERPYPFDPLLGRYLLPALMAFAVLIALFRWRHRPRVGCVWVAALCYVLLVLPVSGPAQSGIQLVAERYAYLATIPLILLAGIAAAHGLIATGHRAMRATLLTAIIATVGTMAASTRVQTRVWKSDETLWRHVLAYSESSLAHNNLGYILYARGEVGQALLHLTSALEHVPVYGRPWRGLAAILEAPRDADAPPGKWVAQTLERAARARPEEVLPEYAVALAWIQADEPALSEAWLLRVLARDPDHSGARLALARLRASGFGTADRADPAARLP